MSHYQDLLVDGKPILAPDKPITVTFTDLDAEDAGRDESGTMHRIPVRLGVRTWELRYTTLTPAQYRYMESLFEGKDRFTLSGLWAGERFSCVAYRSGHSVSLHRAPGLYGAYSFRMVEC